MALFRCGAGEAFDISTIPAGSCAHGYSSNSSGYAIADITSSTVITPTTVSNDVVTLGIVNTTGFDTLTVRGDNDCIAFALNKDGSLSQIYAARLASGTTVHNITVTGYDYVIFSTPSQNNVGTSVQIA